MTEVTVLLIHISQRKILHFMNIIYKFTDINILISSRDQRSVEVPRGQGYT